MRRKRWFKWSKGGVLGLVAIVGGLLGGAEGIWRVGGKIKRHKRQKGRKRQRVRRLTTAATVAETTEPFAELRVAQAAGL